MKDMDATYTTAELAERWKVHIETVRRRLRKGDLGFFTVGRQKRIPANEVRRYEKESMQPAHA